MKAEHYDARKRLTGPRGDLGEVQVEGEDHALLGVGLGEDLAVGQPLQPLIAQVRRAEALHDEIESERNYPFDFIQYRHSDSSL